MYTGKIDFCLSYVSGENPNETFCITPSLVVIYFED